MTPDELFSQTLRLRQALNAADASRLAPRCGPAYPTIVGCVFANPTVPTTTGVYFSVHPVSALGVESEGAVPVLAVDTSRYFEVYVLPSSSVPVAGDYLVCKFVGNRWAANRGVTAVHPTCEVCVFPEGCYNAGLVGSAVTVKLAGTTIGTCATDITGKCCVPIAASGSYTIKADPPAGSVGLNSVTVTRSLVCPGTNNVVVNLTNSPGYACACFYGQPLPAPSNTLTVTDPTYGTTSVQEGPGRPVGIDPTNYWIHNATFPGTGPVAGYAPGGCRSPQNCPGVDIVGDPIHIDLWYVLTCTGVLGTSFMDVYYSADPTCCCPGTRLGNNICFFRLGISSFVFSPPTYTITFGTLISGRPDLLYPGGTPSITVTFT